MILHRIAGLAFCLCADVTLAQGPCAPQLTGVFVSQAQISAELGQAVAVEGNTLIVGAPGATPAAIGATGAAHVYVRTGSSWVQTGVLQASDAAPGARFGHSLAVDRDTLVVGSTLSAGGGALYVFAREGLSWVEQARIPRPAVGTANLFGSAVAIDRDTLVATARGGLTQTPDVHVFERVGGEWLFRQRFLGSKLASVAVSSGTVAIGLPTWGTMNPGQVNVYEQAGAAWNIVATLTDQAPLNYGGFGRSVALSGWTLLVGQARYDPEYGPDPGKVVVFARQGGLWTQQAVMAHPNPSGDDHFGETAALEGQTALIGAPNGGQPPAFNGAGGVLVFRRAGATWSPLGQMAPQTPQFFGEFGQAVALHGSIAAAGVERHSPTQSGASAFDVPCPECPADCSGDGTLSVADFSCFQSRFVAGDPYADCNDSGSLTIADFACFQTKFAGGCP